MFEMTLLFYSSRSSWGDTKKVVMGPSFVGRIDVRQWKALELVGQDRKLGAVQLGSVPPPSAAAPDRQVFALATPSDHAMSMAKRQDMRLHPWPARIASAILSEDRSRRFSSNRFSSLLRP